MCLKGRTHRGLPSLTNPALHFVPVWLLHFIGQSLVKMQSVKSTNYRKRGLTITERILAKSHYYEVAREFGRLCVARVGATGYMLLLRRVGS